MASFMFAVVIVVLTACCIAGFISNEPDRFDAVDFDFDEAADRLLAK